jgi:hypothetical protein
MASDGDLANPYDLNADIYDATALAYWPHLQDGLRRLLATLPPSGATVVDVGAGTGLATVVLARSSPDSEAIAVEPSASLRVGLSARVVDDPDLQRRVPCCPPTGRRPPVRSLGGGEADCHQHDRPLGP